MKKYLMILVLAVVVVGCDAQQGFEKASEIATRGEGYAEKVGMIPYTQPYAGATSAVLGGLAVITSGIAAWLKKKNEKQDKALKTVLVAVDDIDGIGNTITTATVAEGVADVVEKAYIES